MTKRIVLVLLTGLNVFLLVALVLNASGGGGAAAFAQAGAQGSRGYLCATAAVDGQEFEMLYMVDVQTRRLYGFGPNPQNRNVELLDVRDLKADFRNEAAAPAPAGGKP